MLEIMLLIGIVLLIFDEILLIINLVKKREK